MTDDCLSENALTDLLDGRLDEAARAALERHIDRCPTCRLLVASVVAPETEPPRARGSALLRYLILDVLGAGGNGVVYAAYDPELDRKVAIKVMRSHSHVSDEQRKNRTLREAQAMARLSHPNVVAVHDVGTVDGKVFVVMDFIDGRTLAAWRTEAERAWRDIVDVFSRAGRGLIAAHKAGLVHRDFKPDNVLIGHDGRVLVTDFGLARAAGPLERAAETPLYPLASQLTRSGLAAGTPAYMAPEQLRGQPVDARSDVFSFAVALYEALYRQLPFAGDTLAALQRAVLDGRIRPPPPGARIPAFIHRALLRGLASDPDARWPSMSRLLAALRPRGARWGLRAGVALVLALAATGVVMVRAERAGRCGGAARRVAGVWDPPRKAALRAAMTASGKPFGDDTWRSVEAAIDGYVRDWSAMRTAACEAARVTGEESAELMELRMSCLDHRLDEVRALTSLLAAPAEHDDPVRAAYNLSSLAACADAAALRAPVPPPRDPGARAEVERLRRGLAEAQALSDLGRYRDQAQRGAELAAAARKVAYRPVEAEALLLWGNALERNSQFAVAADTLRLAVWAAEEGHDVKLAVRARAQLAWTVHQAGKPELSIEYCHDARALLVGLGGDADLDALLAGVLSNALSDRGDEASANKLAQLALDERRAALGPDHPLTAIALVNVAVGLRRQNQQDESLKLYRQALAIYEKSYGVHHPLYAQTLFNIADAEMGLGRYDDARIDGERALALLKTALGEEHALVASAENVLGLVAFYAGKPADAQPHFERALALGEKVRGPRHVFVARYAVDLGVDVVVQGQRARALELFRRAHSIYVEAGNQLMAADALSKIGHVQLELGDRRGAADVLERALRVQEAADKDLPDIADTRFTLAQAIWPADRARARRLAQSALAAFAARGPTGASSHDEVAHWLATVAAR